MAIQTTIATAATPAKIAKTAPVFKPLFPSPSVCPEPGSRVVVGAPAVAEMSSCNAKIIKG